MMALNLIAGIKIIFSGSVFALSYFILLSIVLYGWFSYQFSRKVLIRKLTLKRKTKDFLQVNAIVTLAFSILAIITCIYTLFNPDIFIQVMKTIDKTATLTQKEIKDQIIISLIFAIIMLIHVIWTMILVKKNKEAFVG